MRTATARGAMRAMTPAESSGTVRTRTVTPPRAARASRALTCARTTSSDIDGPRRLAGLALADPATARRRTPARPPACGGWPRAARRCRPRAAASRSGELFRGRRGSTQLGEVASDGREDRAQRRADAAGEPRHGRAPVRRRRVRGREARRAHGLVAGGPHGGELSGVRLPLLARLVELLAELRDVVAGLDALGGQRQDLGPAFELVATAVAHGHPREPGALGLGGRRAVGAQHDRDDDLVRLAPDRDGAAGAAAVAEHDVEHPAQLGLVAEDLGAAPGLDRHARLGGDLPEQRRQVDAASPAADADRARVQAREHAHRVVERRERGVDSGGVTMSAGAGVVASCRAAAPG